MGRDIDDWSPVPRQLLGFPSGRRSPLSLSLYIYIYIYAQQSTADSIEIKFDRSGAIDSARGSDVVDMFISLHFISLTCFSLSHRTHRVAIYIRWILSAINVC